MLWIKHSVYNMYFQVFDLLFLSFWLWMILLCFNCLYSSGLPGLVQVRWVRSVSLPEIHCITGHQQNTQGNDYVPENLFNVMDIILQTYPEMCSSSDSDLATLGPRGFRTLGGAEGANEWWAMSCFRCLREQEKLWDPLGN